MELVSLKLASALAILVVGLIGGVIPLAVARLDASQRLFSLGNAFAGGVFLGVGFVHLLPQGIEQLGEVVEYPLGALLGALGLVALLLIDRVLFDRSGPTRRSLYPFVLLAMLSIHSLFAGITLGIAEHAVGVTALLVGTLGHKGSAAFALMVNCHAAAIGSAWRRIMLGVFVVMTPGGVLLGLLLASLLAGGSEVATLIEGGFNALAAGTFIYVAIFDIIGAELPSREDRASRSIASAPVAAESGDMPMSARRNEVFVKFALVVIGIALMAMLEGAH